MEDEFGFIRTIEEDEIIEYNDTDDESDDSDVDAVKIKKQTVKSKGSKELNEDFIFHGVDDDFEKWKDIISCHKVPGLVEETFNSLDDKIAKIRRQLKRKDSKFDDDAQDNSDAWTSEDEERTDMVRTKTRKTKKRSNEEKIKYSEEVTAYKKDLTFVDMNLSRPIMKALSLMNFKDPTPIQKACIPMALMGKDISACAATGTGKTAAFMLPIIERLVHKPQTEPVTRVLVLTPTRELAIQIHQVTRQLLEFTGITVALAAGGLDIKAQEAALRLGPDIVIATPGRLIDNIHNSQNFHLSDVEILVLDEADRMLDEYFADQMKEVMRACSRQRQTMLFSATMTEAVKDLAAVSLKAPVRIFVNQNTDVALNLRQEFIRVRPNHESDREAIVAALVKRTFHDHCIVFIQTKWQAHRMHIILGLLGIRVAELHGNLKQAQRLDSLDAFKNGTVDVLLATDLAARGLDIDNVKTVINFSMPNSQKHYVHRVGRTARAGKNGRAITLAGEKERKIMKSIVKAATDKVKARVVPQEVINKYAARIQNLEETVQEILKDEKVEREIEASEQQVKKASKRLEDEKKLGAYTEEYRGWFQTKKQRMESAKRLRLGTDPTAAAEEKKPKAKTAAQLEVEEDRKFQGIAARAAKRARRNVKVGQDRKDIKHHDKGGDKPRKRKLQTFDKDMTRGKDGFSRGQQSDDGETPSKPAKKPRYQQPPKYKELPSRRLPMVKNKKGTKQFRKALKAEKDIRQPMRKRKH